MGQKTMTTMAIEIIRDERDYDSWLTTLTEASERLDVLQTVVDELRELCEHEDVVQSQEVIGVLQRYGAAT
jgi:hypothetical protein